LKIGFLESVSRTSLGGEYITDVDRLPRRAVIGAAPQGLARAVADVRQPFARLSREKLMRLPPLA